MHNSCLQTIRRPCMAGLLMMKKPTSCTMMRFGCMLMPANSRLCVVLKNRSSYSTGTDQQQTTQEPYGTAPGTVVTRKDKKKHLKTEDTFKESEGVLVTTKGSVTGYRTVDEMGIVVGSSVKSRHVGHDLWARVKGFFGGTITSYSEMMVDSSAEATYNLMREAKKRGANAVVRVRYQVAASTDPAVWSSTFSYTMAYGTAVLCVPHHPPPSGGPSTQKDKEKTE